GVLLCSSRLELDLAVGTGHPGFDLTLPLELGVDLDAEEQHAVRQPEPDQERHDAAERAVRLVVGAEVRDVEREGDRSNEPDDEREDATRADPTEPLAPDVR